MNKNVKIVFDRKKTAAKTGKGKIEIVVYLNRSELKRETVATATPDDWEVVSLGRNIQAKVKHYEEILKAMQTLQR